MTEKTQTAERANIRPFKQTFVQLDSSVYVDDSSILVGDIVLGEDSSVWPLCAARGDVNIIRIGQRTNIQDGTILHVSRPSPANPNGYPLLIGDEVTVGHKCMLHGCVIGNRVLVGMGAIVMDGAIVEDDVMIAAGSLISPNKRLESGYLYVGNPAKQKRPLKEQEIAFLKASADNYVRLKNVYLSE